MRELDFPETSLNPSPSTFNLKKDGLDKYCSGNLDTAGGLWMADRPKEAPAGSGGPEGGQPPEGHGLE